MVARLSEEKVMTRDICQGGDKLSHRSRAHGLVIFLPGNFISDPSLQTALRFSMRQYCDTLKNKNSFVCKENRREKERERDI